MENIKTKLTEAIRRDGEYFMLNEPLNDELIYQLIFDTYFKDLTVEDIREFVTISVPEYSMNLNRDRRASFNLKLIMNFSMNDRFDKLRELTLNPY